MTISHDAEALFGVAANGSDVRPNLINAIATVGAAGGGFVELPPGDLIIEAGGVPMSSNVVLRGHHTTLKFVQAGPKFVIGDASGMVFDVGFHDLSYFCLPFDDPYFLFSADHVRGIAITGRTRFKNVHGFMRLGTAQLMAGTVFVDGHIEGDMAPQHGHFFDFVNMPGGAYLGGVAAIEGNFNAGGHFVNSTQSRADGFTMNGGWTVRKFDCFFNVRRGLANWLIQNSTFDGFRTMGLLADSEYEAVNGLQFQGNHLAGGYYNNPSVDARGILISRVAEEVKAMITGNRIFDTGCEAIWTAGEGVFSVTDNMISNASMRADNGYAAIRIGAYSRGVCADNVVVSTFQNRHAYGVNNESQSMRTHHNYSSGHGIAAQAGNIES